MQRAASTTGIAATSAKMTDASVTTGADYHCEITAPVTAEEAFEKIGRVSEWWAKNFEGRAQRLDDVFTVRWGETFVTFRITAVAPNTTVVWTVTDSYIGSLEDKTEWTGTKAAWKIAEKDGATTIQFAHMGLVPAVECYEMCVKGWDQYVKGSLLQLLTENKGQPN
ncbi:MAG: SRPBCC domain-containing protein [Gemmatimonadota bacterium]|nr:SRPBCC domain-containing protein [Gemmatimonadota bacterium]